MPKKKDLPPEDSITEPTEDAPPEPEKGTQDIHAGEWGEDD